MNFSLDAPKPALALRLMRVWPQGWFRHVAIDARDRALLDAVPVPSVDYGKSSYLRKMYHLKQHEGENFGTTDWIVETDQ
ncbi:Uu.00g107250.m01.CDS01 [Anthostomella pinea]|uniref:Uu.00g107250.m01.CDS01 n=1 Tax=Anthostomella pinea TaxID=933095 RepID=A0AAI8VEA9_9PEZI|nr:Uu.00g107250.m01.CDS01 [Anthostomella pinea]